jgi:hypothetical protein
MNYSEANYNELQRSELPSITAQRITMNYSEANYHQLQRSELQ